MPVYQYTFTNVATGSVAPGGSNLNNQTFGVWTGWTNPGNWILQGGTGAAATIPQNPGGIGYSGLLTASGISGPIVPTNQAVTGLFVYNVDNGQPQFSDVLAGNYKGLCAVAINGAYNGFVLTTQPIGTVSPAVMGPGSFPYTGPGGSAPGTTSMFGWPTISAINVQNISVTAQWYDNNFQPAIGDGVNSVNLTARSLALFVTTAFSFSVPVMPRRKYMVSLVDQLP